MSIERYPLSWPQGWKRTTRREIARFGVQKTEYNSSLGQTMFRGTSRLTVAAGIERVQRQLRAMYVSDSTVIISTNIPTRNDGLPRSGMSEPSDPGVAVYWKRKGKEQCIAIDRYTRVADNLAAIAATLDAFRAIERHGGGEILDRSFQGFAQLPAAIVTARSWREVLGFALNERATADEVESRFRDLTKKHHPDAGGEEDRMRELIQARLQARAEVAA